MASNKITYTFVAIDEFTKVANKIQKSVQNLSKTIDKVATPVNKKMATSFNHVAKAAKSANRYLQSASDALYKTSHQGRIASSVFSRLSGHIAKSTAHIQLFGHWMARASDSFGMGAYYRFMNIALPMAIVAKLGFEYADSIESANMQLSTMFSRTKDFAMYQKIITEEAQKYSKITRFSAADIMAAAAITARMTGNIKTAGMIMPVIIRYAIGTNQTKDLAAATKSFLQGVRSGRLPGVMGARLTGATGDIRLRQAAAMVQRSFGGIMTKDIGTASAQLAKFTNSFKELAGVIVGMLAPAFEVYNKYLAKFVPRINHFVKAHKELVKVLGVVAIASTIFLGVLMALGAIIGIIAIPFEILGGVIGFFAGAIGIAKVAIMALNLALGANPYWDIIAAVIALIPLVIAMVKNFGGLKAIFTNVFDWGASKVKMMADEVCRLVDGLKKVGHYFGMKYEHFKHKVAFGVTALETMGATNLGYGMGAFHKFEHLLHVNVNVNDPGGAVSSVHTSSSSGVMSHANLGRNLNQT